MVQRPVDEASLRCLSTNIYFEARNQSLLGMIAVAVLTITRKDDRRFADTVCGVVHEGVHEESSRTKGKDMPDHERIFFPKRHMCQFSWYCDGDPDIALNEEKWNEAQTVAYQIVTKGTFRGITEGANHYHATYVDPKLE